MMILTLLLVLAGGLIANEAGLYFGLVFAVIMNISMYWFSDKIAIKMSGAQPISETQAPELYNILHRLTRNSRMPMPKVYMIPSEQPNAFASGRNPQNSVVAVTRGILKMLDKEELEGVIAHELAHIKNRDILIATIAAVMAGALAIIARMGMYRMMWGGRRSRESGATMLIQLLAIILAPMAALLIRMAVSRTREYEADKTGSEIADSSKGLKNALIKMERAAQNRPLQVNEAAAHMFIINPLSANYRGRNSGMGNMAKLFSTHPPIKERVKRLEALRI